MTKIMSALSSGRAVLAVASVLLAALRIIPGLIVILLSSLTFVVYPFVSDERQRSTRELVTLLIQWTVSGDISSSTSETQRE
ncbi:hypothetical protein [Streptomyces scopuliridis]|uniref:hypothetical protein n=1 Tax=Streptomyces scopuliridis TaxID=452529 RepID=UPI0034276CF9